MPSTFFKQADVRRAVKAALDAGFPVSVVEVELPNGVKMRLLPEIDEAVEIVEAERKPESW